VSEGGEKTENLDIEQRETVEVWWGGGEKEVVAEACGVAAVGCGEVRDEIVQGGSVRWSMQAAKVRDRRNGEETEHWTRRMRRRTRKKIRNRKRTKRTKVSMWRRSKKR
jgi:hypothetical protein